MLSRSFFPNFGQGPFPKIVGKSPVLVELYGYDLDSILSRGVGMFPVMLYSQFGPRIRHDEMLSMIRIQSV